MPWTYSILVDLCTHRDARLAAARAAVEAKDVVDAEAEATAKTPSADEDPPPSSEDPTSPSKMSRPQRRAAGLRKAKADAKRSKAVVEEERQQRAAAEKHARQSKARDEALKIAAEQKEVRGKGRPYVGPKTAHLSFPITPRPKMGPVSVPYDTTAVRVSLCPPFGPKSSSSDTITSSSSRLLDNKGFSMAQYISDRYLLISISTLFTR